MIFLAFLLIYVICFFFLYVKRTEYLSMATLLFINVCFAMYSTNNTYLCLSSPDVNFNYYFVFWILGIAVFGLLSQIVASLIFMTGYTKVLLEFEGQSEKDYMSPKYVNDKIEYKWRTVVLTGFCFILITSMLYKPEIVRRRGLSTLFIMNVIGLSGIILYNSIHQYTNAIDFMSIKDKKPLGLYTQGGSCNAATSSDNNSSKGWWDDVLKKWVGGTDNLNNMMGSNDGGSGTSTVADAVADGTGADADAVAGTGDDAGSSDGAGSKVNNRGKNKYSNSFTTDPDVMNAATELEQCSKRQRFIQFQDGEICYLTVKHNETNHEFISDGGIKLLPIDDNNTTFNLISLRKKPIKLSSTKYVVDTSNKIYINKNDLTDNLKTQIKLLTDTNGSYLEARSVSGWDKIDNAMKKAGNITSQEAQTEQLVLGSRSDKRFVRSNNPNDNKFAYITRHGCAKPINDLENPSNHVDAKILGAISYGKDPYPDSTIVNYVTIDGIKNVDSWWNLMDYPGAQINDKYTVIPQTGWFTTDKL